MSTKRDHITECQRSADGSGCAVDPETRVCATCGGILRFGAPLSPSDTRWLFRGLHPVAGDVRFLEWNEGLVLFVAGKPVWKSWEGEIDWVMRCPPEATPGSPVWRIFHWKDGDAPLNLNDPDQEVS